MQDEYRFNAFGRLLAVVRKNDCWAVFDLGAEGKRRPAGRLDRRHAAAFEETRPALGGARGERGGHATRLGLPVGRGIQPAERTRLRRKAADAFVDLRAGERARVEPVLTRNGEPRVERRPVRFVVRNIKTAALPPFEIETEGFL